MNLHRMYANTDMHPVMCEFKLWDIDGAKIPPWWSLVVVVLVLLAICYLIRPLFHGIIIAVYKSPLLVMFLCAIIVLGITNLLLKRKAHYTVNKDTAKYRQVEKTNQVLSLGSIASPSAPVPFLSSARGRLSARPPRGYRSGRLLAAARRLRGVFRSSRR